tara:strand:- start:303 stop:806 length:504 start_codon:yes stop_codon:yes gene_type:complete
MADTAKVEYTVSMTPITTLEANAGQNVATDVINIDIGKGLSGQADVTVDTAGHTTVGYAAGVVAYLEAVDDAKTQVGADHTVYDFVFIKHTGKSYGTATALGDTIISVNLNVFIEYTAGSAWATICGIPPGGAIALPNFPTQGSSKGIFVQPASGTNHIAVEYALIT